MLLLNLAKAASIVLMFFLSAVVVGWFGITGLPAHAVIITIALALGFTLADIVEAKLMEIFNSEQTT